MSDQRPGQEIERELERGGDELEERLQKLGDHIEDAQTKAEPRAVEADAGEAAAGDWEDTKGTAGQGEDPEGAAGGTDAPGVAGEAAQDEREGKL